MHEKVKGETPAGAPYAATDEALLNWVQATASFGFIEAYSAYASPLTEEEKSKAYQEAQPAAALYGATGAPGSVAEQCALFAQTEPRFERADIIYEFLDVMAHAKVMPFPISAAEPSFLRAAIQLTPESVRERLKINQRRFDWRPGERRLVKLAGALAERFDLKSTPAALARARLSSD